MGGYSTLMDACSVVGSRLESVLPVVIPLPKRPSGKIVEVFICSCRGFTHRGIRNLVVMSQEKAPRTHRASQFLSEVPL